MLISIYRHCLDCEDDTQKIYDKPYIYLCERILFK